MISFYICCKGIILLCSLSAQSKECAKMKEKKAERTDSSCFNNLFDLL